MCHNMINKILLNTAYFPPIEYFVYIVHAKELLIEAHENYNKQSYRNRAYIYTANGQLELNIPIKKNGLRHAPIRSVTLDDSRWKTNHLRAMDAAYNTAPFYLYYQDEIKNILIEENHSLFLLNHRLLHTLCQQIGLSTPMSATKEFIKSPPDVLDLRDKIHPKKKTPFHQIHFPEYTQVFHDKHGFIKNLSILDLLFNLGPESKDYLKNCMIA